MNKVQIKLWNGYGKISKILGESFTIYRTTSLIRPISSLNYVCDTTCWFKPDGSTYKVYVNGNFVKEKDNVILVGDYFISPSNKIYIITDLNLNSNIKAIDCPDRMNIERVEYVGIDSIGKKVGVDIPCKVLRNTAGEGISYIPIENTASDPINSISIKCGIPVESILKNDRIVINNIIYQVNSVYWDSGTTINAKEYKP